MTAEMLISECKAAGVTVALSPEGKLRVHPPGRLSDVLRAELKKQKAEVLGLLSHPATPEQRVKTILPQWNERMLTLTDWFLEHVAELPSEPFDLGVAIRIADPARFYALLAIDIAAGPIGPRGRSGAVEDDLMALMERWAIMHEDVDN